MNKQNIISQTGFGVITGATANEKLEWNLKAFQWAKSHFCVSFKDPPAPPNQLPLKKYIPYTCWAANNTYFSKRQNHYVTVSQ